MAIKTIPKEERDYNNYDDIVVNKVKKLYDTILRTYHSSPDKDAIEMHIYLPQSQIKSSQQSSGSNSEKFSEFINSYTEYFGLEKLMNDKYMSASILVINGGNDDENERYFKQFFDKLASSIIGEIRTKETHSKNKKEKL